MSDGASDPRYEAALSWRWLPNDRHRTHVRRPDGKWVPRPEVIGEVLDPLWGTFVVTNEGARAELTEWCEELESGRHEQTTNVLTKVTAEWKQQHCCLGLKCWLDVRAGRLLVGNNGPSKIYFEHGNERGYDTLLPTSTAVRLFETDAVFPLITAANNSGRFPIKALSGALVLAIYDVATNDGMRRTGDLRTIHETLLQGAFTQVRQPASIGVTSSLTSLNDDLHAPFPLIAAVIREMWLGQRYAHPTEETS